MPKIYRAYNPLKKQMYYNIFYIFIFWFAGFLLMTILEALEIFSYFGFFVLSFVCLITSFFGRRIKVILSGLEGENDTIRAVQKIPFDYTVFANVILNYQERKSETDLIVVGEKGVFLIEVKNHLGVITGKEKEKNWIQFKETKNGGKYVNPFYNPTKQVKTHVFRLAGILKNNGFNGWIQGVVYFSNSDTEVKAFSKDIPVLTTEKTFEDFLENYKPRKKISIKDQEVIIESIKEQILAELEDLKEKKKRKAD